MGKRTNDIERYLGGEMTPAEMHAFEKQALADPFLAEALEGAEQTGKDSFLFDLKELHHTFHQRTRRQRPKFISMWNWSIGIAAGLILLAVSGVYVINSIIHQNRKPSLAQAEKMIAPDSTVAADSVTRGDQLLSMKEEPKAAENKSAQRQVKPFRQATRPSTPVGESPNTQTSRSQPMQAEEQAVVEADDVESRDLMVTDKPSLAQLAEDSVHTRERISAPSNRSDVSTSPSIRIRGSASGRIAKGKVTSAEDGTALPGVNVVVKGTTLGAVTNAEGFFEIPVSDQQTLVFNFIGMKQVEVNPATAPSLHIQMVPDLEALSELVVIGNDEARRRAVDDPNLMEFAEPQGGRNAFQQYLEQKVHYPEQALKNKIEGRVTVQFTVGSNGELADFKILKGLGYGCDEEVIRLIKEGPAWTPSRRNTKPVSDKVNVRLKFDIPD